MQFSKNELDLLLSQPKPLMLVDADLKDAEMIGADLSEARLSGANMSNTNLSDAELDAIKANGGVVMVTPFSKYLHDPTPTEMAKLGEIRTRY